MLQFWVGAKFTLWIALKVVARAWYYITTVKCFQVYLWVGKNSTLVSWSWYNVCGIMCRQNYFISKSLNKSVNLFSEPEITRKWEKLKHSRDCLISSSPSATRDQVGRVLCLVGLFGCMILIIRLIYAQILKETRIDIDISLQCDGHQGESYESCGKSSELLNLI